MEKRHFTIMVEPPFSVQVHQNNLIKNCAGQLIAFDGVSTLDQIDSACSRLAPHCHKVQSFVGQNMGKMIYFYLDGIYQDF